MKRPPPKKQPGMGTSPHTINGAMMDLRTTTGFLGGTEKHTRGLVARRMIPFRRLGGRIIFIRTELEQWLANLGGCNLAEARANQEARR